ncbi:hypothetical protein LEP1GSC038_3932 [Leptospira weilii str. 2006001855]|uniref:Uncharacterized protein n=2 Tax=Leptospira TaxID=171 RepID=V6I6F2_9LEPT|nr:hypothetical protein LEP1GSC038_3932 [Leptospira weilii str. 2006001855]EQA61584.1 hypothetical protein LEP1GSC062_2657 [Leptospira alexanderi serovar Manhao 3 str. L 60]
MNENSRFRNSILASLKNFPLCLGRSIRSYQYFRKVVVEPFLNKYPRSIEPFFARLKTKADLYFPKNFLLKVKDRVIRF